MINLGYGSFIRGTRNRSLRIMVRDAVKSANASSAFNAMLWKKGGERARDERAKYGDDNKGLRPFFRMQSLAERVDRAITRTTNAICYHIDLAMETMRAIVLRERPILLGCRNHSTTDAAVAWLNAHGIEHWLYLVDQPFFDNVKVNNEQWFVDGISFGSYARSLFDALEPVGGIIDLRSLRDLDDEDESEDDEEDDRNNARSIYESAPPVLFLPNEHRVVGFDAVQYAIAFGKAEVKREHIFPGDTAPDGHIQPMFRALVRELRDNLWPDGIGRTVLDFGCGHGDNVAWLSREMGPELEAVGYDPNFAQYDDWSGAPRDIVVMHRVLNVIPSNEERVAAIAKACSVRPKLIYVAVPTHSRYGFADGEGPQFFCQSLNGGTVHFQEFDENGDPRWIFQRGFTVEELDALFRAEGYVPDDLRTKGLKEALDETGFAGGLMDDHLVILRVFSQG